MTGAGLPHSDILGSQLGWQLPEAYRGLPRPSSAPDAQASTVRPSKLNTKMLASTMLFSNNHPPPLRSSRHQQPHPDPQDLSGERYGEQKRFGHQRQHTRRARVFSQDPTVCRPKLTASRPGLGAISTSRVVPLAQGFREQPPPTRTVGCVALHFFAFRAREASDAP